MSRTRVEKPDTARGHVMNLRAHQNLVASYEQVRNIPDPDRSYLRVKENARGSCLLIHGVSTRPGDLRELAARLFDADFNVYVLRLPDYGTPGHTISEVSWESSLHQAVQCFRLLARGGGKVHENLFQRMAVRLKLHRLGFVHNWLGWNADLMVGMDKARGGVGKLKIPIYAAQCDDDDRASPSSLRFLQGKARHAASRFQVFPTGGHAILAEHGDRFLYGEILKFCSGGSPGN